MRRFTVVALAMAMLVLGIAIPASATKPDAKFVDVFSFDAPAGSGPDDSGCDFAIHLDGVAKVQIRDHGFEVVFHNNVKLAVTNLGNGQSLDDNGTWKDTFVFDEGFDTPGDDARFGNIASIDTTGSIFRITVPGQGIVAQDTGKIVFDPDTGEVFFLAGPHEVFFGGPNVLCPILGGNPA